MDANQYIGVPFWTLKRLDKFNYPNGLKIGTIAPAEWTEKVYSWVERDGQLWWWFADDYSPGYWIKHNQGNFSEKKIKEYIESNGSVLIQPLPENKTFFDWLKNIWWIALLILIIPGIIKAFRSQ